MMNVSKQILFFLIFFIQPLFAPLILQKTADEHSQLGWQAYNAGNIALAIVHFKAGMKAKNTDTDVTRLKYSRGYCGYGYVKLMSEQMCSNPRVLNEVTYKSIIKGFALILEISLNEEQDKNKRYKIEKMQESATRNINNLDMIKKLVILKESNPCFKTMEVLD